MKVNSFEFKNSVNWMWLVELFFLSPCVLLAGILSMRAEVI